MKLFRKHWFSYLREKEMRKLFPPERTRSALRIFIRVSGHVLFHLALTLILFSFFILVDSYGNHTAMFDKKVVSDLIGKLSSTLITIPLGMIAAVIPIMILSFEFFSSRSEGKFMSRFYRATKIKGFIAVIVLLIILDIGIVILDGVGSSAIITEVVKYGFIFSLVFTLLVIIHASMFIMRTVKTLSIKNLFHIIRSDMKYAAMSNLRSEVSYRLGRNMFNYACSKHEMMYVPRHRSEHQPIRSNKKGHIVDINIRKLQKIKDKLKHRLLFGLAENRMEYRLIFSEGPGSMLQVGDIIGYVNSGEDESFGQELSKCLKIKEQKPQENLFRIYSTEYKDLAIKAIDQNTEHIFEQILDGYLDIFRYYMDYIIKAKLQITRDTIQNSFIEWRVIFILIRDLEDVMEMTLKSPNRSFTSLFAHKLSELILVTIAKRDIHLYKRAIEMSIGMYLFSHLSRNTVGLERCISVLTNVVDFHLNPLIEDANVETLKPDDIEDFRFMYTEIVNTLSAMMYRAYAEGDMEAYGKIFRAMDEFAVWLHPDYHQEIFRLETELEEDRDNEVIKKKLSVAKSIQSIGSDLASHILKTVFKVGASLCEKYVDAKIDEDQCGQYLGPLLSKLSLNSLVENFEYLLLNPESLSVWGDIPESKRVTSRDWSRKFTLFYCVRGMQIMSDLETLPDARPQRFNLDRIRETCASIADQPEKWSWIFTVSGIRENADRFIEFNEAMAHRHEEEEQQEIIDAELSDQKVEASRNQILKEFGDWASVRYWLNQHGMVRPFSERLSEEPCPDDLRTGIGIRVRLPKDIFLEEPHTHYVGAIERRGQGFANGENKFIIDKLVDNAGTTGAEADNVESTLSDGIERLKNHSNGYNPSLIVIPSHLRSTFRIMGSERFVHAGYRQDEGAHCFGYFDDIPVIFPLGTEIDSILILDLEKAFRLYDIEEVRADIRSFTAAEKQAILEKHEELTERQLELEILLEVKEEICIEVLDKNSILRIPLGEGNESQPDSD